VARRHARRRPQSRCVQERRRQPGARRHRRQAGPSGSDGGAARPTACRLCRDRRGGPLDPLQHAGVAPAPLVRRPRVAGGRAGGRFAAADWRDRAGDARPPPPGRGAPLPGRCPSIAEAAARAAYRAEKIALHRRAVRRRLKRLQDDLGSANDVHLGETLLPELAQDTAKGAEIAAAGRQILDWHKRRLARGEKRLREDLRHFLQAEPFWHP